MFSWIKSFFVSTTTELSNIQTSVSESSASEPQKAAIIAKVEESKQHLNTAFFHFEQEKVNIQSTLTQAESQIRAQRDEIRVRESEITRLTAYNSHLAQESEKLRERSIVLEQQNNNITASLASRQAEVDATIHRLQEELARAHNSSQLLAKEREIAIARVKDQERELASEKEKLTSSRRIALEAVNNLEAIASASSTLSILLPSEQSPKIINHALKQNIKGAQKGQDLALKAIASPASILSDSPPKLKTLADRKSAILL